jgi:glutamine---fructose-6-phosphate transaminase (isomerizing)
MIDYDPTSGYLRDILAQPEALEATRLGLEADFDLGDLPARLARGEFARVLLTGMGSSFHGLVPLYYHLAQRGLPVSLLETSELIHQLPEVVDPRALVVAVSQSGRSAETVRLLDLAEANGAPVLGVTNTPTSPLAVRSAARVLTCAGEEATVSCKTYQAALLALRWLGAALTGDGLDAARAEAIPLAAAVSSYLAHWREHTARLEERLAGVQQVFLVGRGSSLAACGTGGLITKESAHVHAEGMSSAALRHGPLEMLGRDCFVMVFAGEERTRALNAGLNQELLAAGIPTLWADMSNGSRVCDLPVVAESLRPVVEILPVEMMTLALARLRGRTAGVFERGSKVTTTE